MAARKLTQLKLISARDEKSVMQVVAGDWIVGWGGVEAMYPRKMQVGDTWGRGAIGWFCPRKYLTKLSYLPGQRIPSVSYEQTGTT